MKPVKLLTNLLKVRRVLLGYTRTEYKLNSTNVDTIGGANSVVGSVLKTFADSFGGSDNLLKDILGTGYSPGKSEGTFPTGNYLVFTILTSFLEVSPSEIRSCMKTCSQYLDEDLVLPCAQGCLKRRNAPSR